MGSPLGRTLHSGCPKSWKILGIRMKLASVVLGLLASSVNAAPQLFGPPSPSTSFTTTSAVSAPRKQNEAAIVGSVISALQPTIAEAVAAALASTSRPSSSSTSSSSAASTGFVPARDSNATPAKYDYIYKVANDGTQTYISQEEQRDGLEVQGTYSYVDPTGAIVTVNYNAGVNGYEETRSRQEGAVKIAPQLPASATTSSSTGLNTDAIIAQVLAALRPTIQTTVGQFVSRG